MLDDFGLGLLSEFTVLIWARQKLVFFNFLLRDQKLLRFFGVFLVVTLRFLVGFYK